LTVFVPVAPADGWTLQPEAVVTSASSVNPPGAVNVKPVPLSSAQEYQSNALSALVVMDGMTMELADVA